MQRHRERFGQCGPVQGQTLREFHELGGPHDDDVGETALDVGRCAALPR